MGRRLSWPTKYTKVEPNKESTDRLIDLSGLDEQIFSDITDTAIIAGSPVLFALHNYPHNKHSNCNINFIVLNKDRYIFNKYSDRLRTYFDDQVEYEDETMKIFNNKHGNSVQITLSGVKSPSKICNRIKPEFLQCWFHRGDFFSGPFSK